ncbi:hypothetical protein CC2G_009190 [Coprinopsis cinerea AmutBmut pab1-1]|nr:hypothetical protein CC2G_009190 [Coprinopsis cinerea AmutBmut pab1-1]
MCLLSQDHSGVHQCFPLTAGLQLAVLIEGDAGLTALAGVADYEKEPGFTSVLASGETSQVHSPAPSANSEASESSRKADKPSSDTISLQLAGDKVLTFSASDLPPPPSATFASDLSVLFQMWDDTSPRWKGTSFLLIRGTPILGVP